MHEIRPLGHIAVVVRQQGLTPPGSSDLILSHALD